MQLNSRIIKKMIGKLRERYPNIHRVLIEERNAVIARNIKNLMESGKDKKILVILGAGHTDEVIELIKHSEEAKISFSFKVG